MDNLSIKKIQINGHENSFHYRSTSDGDLGVIGQVLDGKCFNIERWHQGRVARAFYNSCISQHKTPLIIDAGANIGASSLYFANLYENSKICAIEPEMNNIRILKENTRSFNVDVVEGGLGKISGELFLQDPGLGDWGFRVGSNNESGVSVPITTIENLLDRYGDLQPFILKIDIEGGELDLFSESSNDWFSKFPVIIFETHDWMLPFHGVSMGLIKIAAMGNYDVIFHGENLFFFNHLSLLPHHNPF